MNLKKKLLIACSNINLRVLLPFTLYLLAFSFYPFASFAQDRPAKASLMFEAGWNETRDTYLTPLQYKGMDIGVRYERLRPLRGGFWENFQAINANFASAEADPGKNSSMWVGRAKYSYALHHEITAAKVKERNAQNEKYNVQLFVGPYASIEGGFNYNLKMANGNNPATAHFATNVGLSLLEKIQYKKCSFEILIQTPLLGTAFMPEFGQSYYEAFVVEDDFDGMHFTSLHNQRDLDVRMNVDIPLSVIPWFKNSKRVARLGIYTHQESMKINHIVTKHTTAGITIGWTWRYLPL